MRFFHIGDLHFGKMLYNVPLTETDQAFWVDRFLEAVDEYGVDAVVIAGDIYDRRVPGAEAMSLFDRLLCALAKREKYVFVIPGNHDSAVRLSHVSSLLRTNRIYIAGQLERTLLHVTVPGGKDDPESVTFWLMPYIFPKAVGDKRVLDREDLSSYDEAARALLSAQEIDESACNVLVAHQNVLAHGVRPEHSESETVIGGIGEIEFSAFDAFDYVALGHIHNAQTVGRENVRYSGCPLYYDFSETGRSKDLTLVTVRSKKDVHVGRVPIPLLHHLLQKTGTLEELTREGLELKEKDSYYIQCILRDRHVPPRAMDQLREVYGDSLVNVKREVHAPDSHPADRSGESGAAILSLEEQFGRFYQEMQNELPDGTQEELVRRIVEQQARQGGDYVRKAGEVPEEDSQELLDLIRKSVDFDSENGGAS